MQPILQENYPFLRQKICLMALIESVFKRGAYDRTMSFQTIAEETRLPLDEVEHLVMKALRYARSRASWAETAVSLNYGIFCSLKLIKGSLDQVDQKAQITWVQPRVLTLPQVDGLLSRLGAWISKVSSAEMMLRDESAGLI